MNLNIHDVITNQKLSVIVRNLGHNAHKYYRKHQQIERFKLAIDSAKQMMTLRLNLCRPVRVLPVVAFPNLRETTETRITYKN